MAPIELSENSNTLPYALFGSYFALTSALIIIVARVLGEAYKSLPPSAAVRYRRTARIHHVEFYAALALVSASAAIYFNGHILALSYRVWELERTSSSFRLLGEHAPKLGRSDGLQLGRWLRETDLLGEFWEIVFERTRRRFWGQQLIMGALPWSIFTVIEGQRRMIPHLWAFIGLAPLVSLSFAQALFFLAILWTPVPLSKRRRYRDAVNSNHPVFTGAILATAVGVAILPFTTGDLSFKSTLTALFVAFLSPLAAPVISGYLGFLKDRYHGPAHRHATFRLVAVLTFLVHLAHLSVAMLDQSDPRGFWNRHSSVLHLNAEPPRWRQAQTRVAKIIQSATDHPSVGRVAVDIALAAVGLFAWASFRGLQVKEILSAIALWGQSPEPPKPVKVAKKVKETVTEASSSIASRVAYRYSHHSEEEPDHVVQRRVVEEDEDDENDADYTPPASAKIQEGDDDREESPEAAALSWGLSVIGGLGYLTAGALGAEVAM